VWVGVPVPVILSQELFDRVQAKLQESRKKYRHPMTHYLLSELVRCGECGASCPSYRRHLGYPLVTGERRIYHRAAYKCVSGTSNKMHARKNAVPQSADRDASSRRRGVRHYSKTNARPYYVAQWY
jgi:hypothetical protein